jgi:hypothetical protein
LDGRLSQWHQWFYRWSAQGHHVSWRVQLKMMNVHDKYGLPYQLPTKYLLSNVINCAFNHLVAGLTFINKWWVMLLSWQIFGLFGKLLEPPSY